MDNRDARNKVDETANFCFGVAEKVRAKLDALYVGLAKPTAEVSQRCRRKLQAHSDQPFLAPNPART